MLASWVYLVVEKSFFRENITSQLYSLRFLQARKESQRRSTLTTLQRQKPLPTVHNVCEYLACIWHRFCLFFFFLILTLFLEHSAWLLISSSSKKDLTYKDGTSFVRLATFSTDCTLWFCLVVIFWVSSYICGTKGDFFKIIVINCIISRNRYSQQPPNSSSHRISNTSLKHGCQT